MNKNNVYYRQCGLRRVTGSIMMSWLPEKFAVKGKYLELKNGNEWQNGWEVLSVSDGRMAHTEAVNQSQNYKKTRRASDI